ncbi:MAG: ornithine cyclodeaminase family protein [Thermoplasmatales archaeon]|jgi:ornithine cyclodeaminase|nr:ornithine cyclodeaminase family protein [Candidatus Thermoplasmatota archaeon]MCL6003003.1 ornithine cyclodeaminase family protein [Candidatus Thermoplasmatota archaeon]MDA8054849.1 ornithine cyclodeaminase family protein [Thermoplasmatales archaeon]
MLVISDSDIPDDQNYRILSEELKKQFVKLGRGISKNLYRTRLETGRGILDLMGGVDEEDLVGAVKQYFYGQSIDFLISFFSTDNSEILAVFPGKKVTRIRTAAASALATDILSRKDSRVLGCIGTGYQAAEQVKAVSHVRSIERVIASDPNELRSIRFKDTIEKNLGIETLIEKEVDGSFREADIIITATTSRTPVIGDEFVRDDCYINSIGSYTPAMRELEISTICRSKIVAVDSLEETSKSTGEIVGALSSGCLKKNDINQFTDLVVGKIRSRKSASRAGSYFKSIGVGVEDLAVAKYLYSKLS